MSNREIAVQLESVASFLRLTEAFRPVKGFLPIPQGWLLCLLAAHGEGRGQIVEIGSFMGHSTCWLAEGTRTANREKVHAIDHFTGSPEHQKGGTSETPEIVNSGSTFSRFQANIAFAGLQDWVTPIVSDSLCAAAKWQGGVIRLLFIDGDHSYEASKADFAAWSPFVGPRGYIAFHDIDAWPGVTRFYNELMAPGQKTFKEMFVACTLRVVQRLR